MSINNYYTGKHVLISGSSSGIGKSLAEHLHQYAEKIYICGRNKSKLEELTKEYPKFEALAFDINNKEETFRQLNKIKKLDILIANAGTCEYIDPPEFDSGIFERIIQTNFLGTVYLLESLLPLLRASKAGHFVSISSSVSFLPLPRAHAYGASKVALNYTAPVSPSISFVPSFRSQQFLLQQKSLLKILLKPHFTAAAVPVDH